MTVLASVDVGLRLPLILPIKARMPKWTISTLFATTQERTCLPFHQFSTFLLSTGLF